MNVRAGMRIVTRQSERGSARTEYIKAWVNGEGLVAFFAGFFQKPGITQHVTHRVMREGHVRMPSQKVCRLKVRAFQITLLYANRSRDSGPVWIEFRFALVCRQSLRDRRLVSISIVKIEVVTPTQLPPGGSVTAVEGNGFFQIPDRDLIRFRIEWDRQAVQEQVKGLLVLWGGHFFGRSAQDMYGREQPVRRVGRELLMQGNQLLCRNRNIVSPHWLVPRHIHEFNVDV